MDKTKRILELHERLELAKFNKQKANEAIMDRYREIKDYTPENDYLKCERVVSAIAKIKWDIRGYNSQILTFTKELKTLMKTP